MSETVNLVAGRTWTTGESVTASKMNTAMTGSTVTITDGNPVGVLQAYLGASEPTGWVFANGLSVGNASSNATSRANADTADLFAVLWDSTDDATTSLNLILQDSAGSTVLFAGRGASASVDYALNYKIAVPNMGGRIPLGVEESGGASNTGIIDNRVDQEILFETMGNVTGKINLVSTDLPFHTHVFGANEDMGGHPTTTDVTTGQTSGGITRELDSFSTTQGGANPTASGTTSVTLANVSGNSNTSQGVMQPSLMTSYIIKL